MSESVLGTCFSMCPEKERWMREREGLLHVFEVDEKTKHLKRPKADPAKTVKCFSRPAAGQLMSDPSQLRPAPILMLTIKYLFTKIITRRDINWAIIYDYVFDRLRAVRQDIVIQRIDTLSTIQLLEPIVRFHVYAAQRLCEQSISAFDPKLNNQHLLECLKNVLVLYDEYDRQLMRNNSEIYENMENLSLNDNRSQMEALYILLHLGDAVALNRGLSLPSKCRSEHVKLALKISLAWYLKNYVRVCRFVQKLPPLLACASLCNFRSFRRNVLQIMSSGYNSKSFTFPGLKLQVLLLYNDIDKIKADCQLFGLGFSNQNVQFQKAKFNETEMLANSERYFSLQMLDNLLPEILLQ